MLTWYRSNYLQDVIASQITPLTSLLSIIVSGANEVSLENSENIYTLEGLSNDKPKVSKIPPGKLQIISEAPVHVPPVAKSYSKVASKLENNIKLPTHLPKFAHTQSTKSAKTKTSIADLSRTTKIYQGRVVLHQRSEAPSIHNGETLLQGVHPRPALAAAENTSVSCSSEILAENLIYEKIPTFNCQSGIRQESGKAD